MKKFFNFRTGIIIILLALVAFFIFNKIQMTKEASKPANINVSQADHVLGNPNAKLTIIEFADLQCPACRAFDPIVNQVVAERAQDVKYIYKHFPLYQIHANAMLAAVGAESAATQGKFWEYKKVLFENQDKWGNAVDSKDKIIEIIKSIGIDTNKWQALLEDKTIQEKVNTDLGEAMRLNLNGTPTVFINGIKVDLSDISTVEKFKAYIDKELSK